MSIISQTSNLVKREILLEQRQKYALYGVLLYVISTVFICKFSLLGKFDFHPKIPKFGRLDKFDDLLITTWNSVFWIILLFASVTAIARSFAQENRGRLLYLYTLADPKAVFLAKLFYNVLLMIFLGFTGLLFYSFFVGFPVVNVRLFFSTLLLGCMGLASAFTMISAIASKAGNNFTLMAILGFPVILPMLLVTIKLSREAVAGFGTSAGVTYSEVLIALNVVIIALAYLLFPYLWRD